MATTTINGLTDLGAPSTFDWLPIWSTSSGVTRKVRKDALVGATITGGGTIATGGFTMTVPATGTVSLLGSAQTFTATKTFGPTSTSDLGAIINMPSGTNAVALSARVNGSEFFSVRPLGNSTNTVILNAFDNTTGPGPCINIGHNSNASTPAAGRIIIANRAGTNHRLWVDASGNMRIWSGGDPTNANDAQGTVVGAQTSALAAKNITGEVVTPGEALRHLTDAAHGALRRFKYKLGQYNGEEFDGVIVDYAPRYGMDLGRSLNLPTLFSDLIQAVTMLSERVEQLESRSE